MTDREVKVKKARNGYIIQLLDYTGESIVFQDFAEMSDFLFDYLGEKKP